MKRLVYSCKATSSTENKTYGSKSPVGGLAHHYFNSRGLPDCAMSEARRLTVKRLLKQPLTTEEKTWLAHNKSLKSSKFINVLFSNVAKESPCQIPVE